MASTPSTRCAPDSLVDLHRHHEGHCGSNYTFASLGGLWDVLFNSRHHGRSNGYAECAATRDDNYRIERQLKPSFRAKGMGWDHPLITPQPLLAYFLLTVHCATHSHF